MLGRSGLDAYRVDGNAHRRAQVLAHRIAVWRELGCLSGNHAIDIENLIALLAHQRRHSSKEFQGIGAFERRIGIGEELADIACAHSAEQRIGYRMGEHVGIRMAEQTAHMRHIDTA